MKCHLCGGKLESIVTQLPFKLSDVTIVIIKDLPVLQCSNCHEYLLEDSVTVRVEEILGRVDATAELEVVRFAA